MKLTAPKGTYDILPSQSRKWQYVEHCFADLCRRFGYREIRIPTFEHSELFTRGVGETSDIVQKEMYTFLDKGGRSLSLRPEGTAGVVRAYIEHGLASEPSPLKLYYQLTAFRYEKMQKGRCREFHQMGCELFGSPEPWADIEMISFLDLFFKEIGVEGVSLRINSIGCPSCRKAYHAVLKDFLNPLKPQLCETCNDRFERNPLRILDCKETKCQHLTTEAPKLIDHLCPDCRSHFDTLTGGLKALDIKYEIDPKIVRGLDYYTRTVFEFVSNNIGTQGTICGGGRYDELHGEMGGVSTPAVGFALGVERLLLELESRGIELPIDSHPDLYILSFPETTAAALKLANDLRQTDLSVETDLLGRSFKAQMKAADRQKAKYLLVLGDTENKEHRGKIKRMSDGFEQELNFSELASWIQSN